MSIAIAIALSLFAALCVPFMRLRPTEPISGKGDLLAVLATIAAGISAAFAIALILQVPIWTPQGL